MTALSTTLWFYDICHARHIDSLDRTSVYCRTIASHRHRYNSLAESRLAGCPFDLYCPFIRRLCEHPLETQTETPHILLDTVHSHHMFSGQLVPSCSINVRPHTAFHQVDVILSFCMSKPSCVVIYISWYTKPSDSCPNSSLITALLYL